MGLCTSQVESVFSSTRQGIEAQRLSTIHYFLATSDRFPINLASTSPPKWFSISTVLALTGAIDVTRSLIDHEAPDMTTLTFYDLTT